MVEVKSPQSEGNELDRVLTPRGPSTMIGDLESILFILPMPPSVNACFAERRTAKEQHRRGRIQTREYAGWIQEAGYIFNQYAKRRMFAPKTRWSLSSTFFFDTTLFNRCDLDNRLKPLIDLLSKQSGLKDNYLMDIIARKSPGHRNEVHGEIQFEASE